MGYKVVLMKPQDSVAVALQEIPAGAELDLGGISVRTREAIEFGHKIAVRMIRHGEDILKYGEVIGMAVRDIDPGEHVHVHNLEGKRGRGDRQ